MWLAPQENKAGSSYQMGDLKQYPNTCIKISFPVDNSHSNMWYLIINKISCNQCWRGCREKRTSFTSGKNANLLTGTAIREKYMKPAQKIKNKVTI